MCLCKAFVCFRYKETGEGKDPFEEHYFLPPASSELTEWRWVAHFTEYLREKRVLWCMRVEGSRARAAFLARLYPSQPMCRHLNSLFIHIIIINWV